jgi:hypothetical protein
MSAPDRALAAALCAAREDADALHSLVAAPPLHLALVCCSYDSDFEPVAAQVLGKVEELLEVFPRGGPVAFRLLVVNDRPPALAGAFEAAVKEGFFRCPPWLLEEERLVSLPLPGAVTAGAWGAKGRALREGVRRALEGDADISAYVNLNRKVHAGQMATGLRLLLTEGLEAAVGSRAFHDGGSRLGAGLLGKVKSRAFAALVHAALPPLGEFPDITGPMKLFTRRAARVLLERGRSDGLCFDAEWLALLVGEGLAVGRFALLWRQRPGSVPPYSLVGEIAGDLLALRQASRRGSLHAPSLLSGRGRRR